MNVLTTVNKMHWSLELPIYLLPLNRIGNTGCIVWFGLWWQLVAIIIQNPSQCYKVSNSQSHWWHEERLSRTDLLSRFILYSSLCLFICLPLLHMHITLGAWPHAIHLTPAHFNPQPSESIYTALEFRGSKPHLATEIQICNQPRIFRLK